MPVGCGCSPGGMRCRVHPALLLLLAFLMLVSTVNSTRQENDDLTNQTKGDSRLLRRSKRRWVITTLELEEEDPGPFPKFVGELFNNMSANMEIIYLIRGPGVDEYPEIGLFSIEDNVNGKIYVHRPVDREKTPFFKVYFDVANRLTGHIVDKSLIINIRINDVNDHAPEFPEKEFNISVNEDHAAGAQGQPVFQMLAVDLDQENTPNSQVFYFLVSQTPVLRESGFRIDRVSGEVRLSGCLDYEMAPRFTLLIGARDYGHPPLSSTATVHVHVQDSNNHMPRFTQDHYNIQISEGWASQGVLRLGVQDGDSPSTAAWRVKFNITNGNEEGHFDISTDPETNEGILNVIKPLDHETQPVWSLVVVMENEEPLFSCEGGQLRRPQQASASATVSVRVTNANDPPTFHPGTFIVSEVDGAGPGTQLGMFNATDPDRTAGQIRYKLAYDPANWVSIDERSGVVITVKPVDRESPHVNDSIYVIIAHAVDDGVPPQTGTGTMLLFLSDVNDNAPMLRPSSQHLEVCQSAGDKPLLIEAEDSDLEPYSNPFTFKLDSTWGDTEDMWRLGENRGYSVELLMQRTLPLGDYSVPLLIGDKQGLSQKQTVHVRVCSCPNGFTCAEPLVARAGVLPGALVPLCVAFLALAAALLLLLRCHLVSEAKGQGRSVPQDEGIQTLIAWNEESRADPPQGRSYLRDHMPALSISPAEAGAKLGAKGHGVCFEPSVRNKYSTPVWLDTAVPRGPLEMRAGVMAEVLSQQLCGTHDPEGDLGYPPHVYAEEGECEQADSLSSLTFSEHDLPPDLLDSLGPKAAPLEEIYSESAFCS
ncbi:cadherin-like protein 26 isoform X4 [Ovis aries]|uniref:cadherin-like protein 26 isoform X4 n=1 Tax=Ovis aries TaxID=9940 RepID=UPI001C2E3681|nr:cadherin-like protein 26 isoform X4 [Ovis aries]